MDISYRWAQAIAIRLVLINQFALEPATLCVLYLKRRIKLYPKAYREVLGREFHGVKERLVRT